MFMFFVIAFLYGDCMVMSEKTPFFRLDSLLKSVNYVFKIRSIPKNKLRYNSYSYRHFLFYIPRTYFYTSMCILTTGVAKGMVT